MQRPKSSWRGRNWKKIAAVGLTALAFGAYAVAHPTMSDWSNQDSIESNATHSDNYYHNHSSSLTDTVEPDVVQYHPETIKDAQEGMLEIPKYLDRPPPKSDYDKDGIPYWMEIRCPEKMFGTNNENCPDSNITDLYLAVYYMKDDEHDLSLSPEGKQGIADMFSEMGIKIHIVDDGNPVGGPIKFHEEFSLSDMRKMGAAESFINTIDSMEPQKAKYFAESYEKHKTALEYLTGSEKPLLSTEQTGVYYKILIVNKIVDEELPPSLGVAGGRHTALLNGPLIKKFSTEDDTLVHESLHLILGDKIPKEYRYIDPETGREDPLHTKWAGDVLYPHLDLQGGTYIHQHTIEMVKEKGVAIDLMYVPK